MVDVRKRNNVRVSGTAAAAIVFAPAFEGRFRTVTFDPVGAGGPDLSAFDRARSASHDRHADDVIEIARAPDVVTRSARATR